MLINKDLHGKEQVVFDIQLQDIQSGDLDEDPVEVEKFFKIAKNACAKVGAVYLDMDCNCTYAALLVAELIIKQKEDILLLSGAVDDMGVIDEKLKVAGKKTLSTFCLIWVSSNVFVYFN